MYVDAHVCLFIYTYECILDMHSVIHERLEDSNEPASVSTKNFIARFQMLKWEEGGVPLSVCAATIEVADPQMR